MVITGGSCTLTSYLGNTGAEGSGLSTTRGWELRSEPTVLPQLEAPVDFLPFVRLGGDGVVAPLGLGDGGMFEVQDASVNGSIQPLGDAVPIGILGGGETR